MYQSNGKEQLNLNTSKQRLLIRDPSALLQVLVVPKDEIDTRSGGDGDDAQAQCCPEQLLTFFALLTGALLYLFLLLDSSINLSSI